MSAENLKVAYLGPPASFSHQAATESFTRTTAELQPHASFDDAFLAVQQQNVDYAVIPFENSTNGSVVQTLDLLADRAGLYKDVKVCGEYYLTVHHCLLVRKGTYPAGWESYDGSITKLYTHPQAWGQCEAFLSQHFKGIERQDVSSTSKGAEFVFKETQERSAAIASRFAAEYHGVDVLKENIEDRADNTTRFLILRNVVAERTAQLGFEQPDVHVPAGQPAPVTTHKTLVSFAIDHSAPGALANALLIFKAHGLNLSSINTRPSLKRAWQYIFFVECGRTPSEENKDAVLKALNDLRHVTEFCTDLGTWKDQLGAKLI
ncbi:Prephenate dehydratase [Penicillium macrosclerotiorum]|uniref:Prephenate dehydratase n=1 Tax=Penicillium macrosclerotiorum TaxID=303699 RepID=UPI002547A871|nr:Prephenate dehydratase [Penicillium macrosclerotiorum]KAJ5693354.1 Prephenate dehydratase [Penicillium macrosclerotiorum]